MRISELGEISILNDFIIPELNLHGEDKNNDCVVIPNKDNGVLIWTIDPLPTPIAYLLGYNDPKILGWYTVLINFSDIASNGGDPIGIMLSIEMPPDTLLDFYLSYNEGVKIACKKFKAKILGGNLRSSDKFRVNATAVGRVTGRNLSRSGVKPNDKIYVIGQTGYFWAAVLLKSKSVKFPRKYVKVLENSLCFPSPQLKAGKLLSHLAFPVACMDCSDGILNCCYQLAKINEVSIFLYEDIWGLPKEIENIYIEHNIPIDNACYNWGEWQLICSVSPEYADELTHLIVKNNIPITCIGYATQSKDTHNVYSAKSKKKLNCNLINERFRNEDYYKNINSILTNFLKQQIFI